MLINNKYILIIADTLLSLMLHGTIDFRSEVYHNYSKTSFPKENQSLFINQRKDDSNIIIDIISEVEVEIGKQTGQVPTPFANEMQT